MERRKETGTQTSTETELPAQITGFLGATSLVLPYLCRNGDNIRPLLSKRDQTGTRGYGFDPKNGPQLLGHAWDPPS